MGIEVNALFTSPFLVDFVFGRSRCRDFSTALPKNSSPRHCKQQHTIDAFSASWRASGEGHWDLGNADDFASIQADVGIHDRSEAFSHSTGDTKPRFRSTRRSLGSASKFWWPFTVGDSEVPQSESKASLPSDRSRQDSVMAAGRAERGTASDEIIVTSEKPTLRGDSNGSTDFATCSDRSEEVSAVTLKDRTDSKLPTSGTIASDVGVGGTDEFVSSTPVPDDHLNDGSIPPAVSPEFSRQKVRRFSLDKPAFLKTIQEGKTLSSIESEQMKLLMSFKLTSRSSKGIIVIRALRVEQMNEVEQLLTDSYAELMWGPFTYRPVLAWILKGYLRERQTRLPHAVTLVSLYAPSDDNELVTRSSTPYNWFLAGVVEVCFNARGQPDAMLTPIPPRDAPFLSNMAVQQKYRRRGIGRQLLKAAEQIAIQMGCKEMYLHCRMVDDAPLSLYRTSGYEIVATDSIFSLLSFQRRRHLLCKRLPEILIDKESVKLMDEVPQSLEDIQ